jgi:hypothetical protein
MRMKRKDAITQGGRETADLSQLPPAARALVLELVEAIAAAEARARDAETAATAAAQREQAAEEAAREAREREAAAVASLAQERRLHAERLAAIAAARTALDAAIDDALGAQGSAADAPPAPGSKTAEEAVASVAAPREIAVDADGETVVAKMIAAGEAQDRAAAIAILVAEAIALRRSAYRLAEDRANAAPPQ